MTRDDADILTLNCNKTLVTAARSDGRHVSSGKTQLRGPGVSLGSARGEEGEDRGPLSRSTETGNGATKRSSPGYHFRRPH